MSKLFKFRPFRKKVVQLMKPRKIAGKNNKFLKTRFKLFKK